jgi:hypothetical protein
MPNPYEAPGCQEAKESRERKPVHSYKADDAGIRD